MLIRINKYLAGLGISSRRKIDTLIYQSRITVNGQLAIPGQKITVDSDQIKIDGQLISKHQPDFEYIVLNKPKKVLSTTKDDKGRNTVLKFVHTTNRLYPIGRLDNDSTGLIMLTNDGGLAQKLTHPKFHLDKTYLVVTSSKIDDNHIQKIRQGIVVDGQITKPATALIYSKTANQTTLKIRLFEGRNRQIRKMFKKLNLKVLSIHRIAIGSIKLGHLKPGQTRPLTPIEIKQLQAD